MDSAWSESAACLGADPEMFHPERGEHEKNDQAINTCTICPVQVHCLDYAIIEQMGVWGKWRAEYRAIIRRREHQCPGCGVLLPRQWPRLFCSDECLLDATSTERITSVKGRITALEARAEQINRDRRIKDDEPEPVDVAELAVA